MSTSSQPTAPEGVSNITDNNAEIALMGVSTYLTLQEAARETGLSLREIHERLDNGTLKARRPIIVRSWDLRQEITARKVAGIRQILVGAIGEDLADKEMSRLGFQSEVAAR